MKITILTLFPEMVRPFFENSIMKRAVEKGIIEYRILNFRDFAEGVHQKADDIPFGGGAGMVIMPEPLSKALDSIDAKNKRVIFPTPSGKIFNQEYAKELSKENELVFICGHYEGIDERVIEEIADMEISIGDFVLTGGELPALVITDAVSRMCEGVLKSSEGFMEESHYNGLLEHAQYTRPYEWMGRKVPDVLLSGHEKNIKEYRFNDSLERTRNKRPDMYEKYMSEHPPQPPKTKRGKAKPSDC